MAMSGDFLARIKLSLEGKEQVVDGLRETQAAASSMNKNLNSQAVNLAKNWNVGFGESGQKIKDAINGIGDAQDKNTPKTNDMIKALRRAAIVAPIWMLLRGAMQQVIQTVQQGFQTWIAFDAQLSKSRAVVHDFSGTTDEAMKILEETVRATSKETGISLASLTQSFYQFGKVGLPFEMAMGGMIAASKLAEATFGDVATISKAMAVAYKMLGNSTKDTLSPLEQQEATAGKIFHLWKSNAFEVDDFSSSLTNFLPIAKMANFSMDESVALLSAMETAGVQNARGGTLLRTSVQQLVNNLGKLGSTLGIAVNPELDSGADILLKILETINKLSKTSGIPAEAMQEISKIFGGARGGQAISALNALLPELKSNLISMAKDPQPFIKELSDRQKEIGDTASHQIEIFNRQKEVLGESFVKGIVGGKDFKESLKEVNREMDSGAKIAKFLGDYWRIMSNPIIGIKKAVKETVEEAAIFPKRVQDAIAGNLTLKDTLETIAMIDKQWTHNAYAAEMQSRILQTAVKMEKVAAIQREINELESKAHPEVKVNENAQLIKTLNLNTKNARGGEDVSNLKALGFSDADVALADLNKKIEEMVNLYNSLDKVQNNILPKLDKQSVLTDVINQNWTGILDKTQSEVGVHDKLTAIAKDRDKLEASIAEEISKQDVNIKNAYSSLSKAPSGNKDAIASNIALMTSAGKSDWLTKRGVTGLRPTSFVDNNGDSFGEMMRTANTKRGLGAGVDKNNYNIPINITGAITNADIEAIKTKIDEKLKAQPNYIDDSAQTKKLAKALRPQL